MQTIVNKNFKEFLARLESRDSTRPTSFSLSMATFNCNGRNGFPVVKDLVDGSKTDIVAAQETYFDTPKLRRNLPTLTDLLHQPRHELAEVYRKHLNISRLTCILIITSF